MTHKPTNETRRQVSELAAAGLTQERAARFMALSVPTFMKHYRDEFEGGLDVVMQELFNVTYDVAKDKDHKDSSRDRQFLLKTRGGYKETNIQEHAGGLEVKSVEWHVVKPSE